MFVERRECCSDLWQGPLFPGSIIYSNDLHFVKHQIFSLWTGVWPGNVMLEWPVVDRFFYEWKQCTGRLLISSSVDTHSGNSMLTIAVHRLLNNRCFLS